MMKYWEKHHTQKLTLGNTEENTFMGPVINQNNLIKSKLY